MPRNNADTDSHIGRRIKLRDLQILFSVAQFGSMAKAASHLSITQPTVSQAIADLEHAVGVRLFDRSTQGVVLTVYGDILLKSGLEAFDALKQGMRGIEFLATPGAGDVWIGCAEVTMHGFVPAVIRRLAQHHPKIVVHAADVNPAENDFQRLRDRRLDLMIGRSRGHVDDDVQVEDLFRRVVLRGDGSAQSLGTSPQGHACGPDERVVDLWRARQPYASAHFRGVSCQGSGTSADQRVHHVDESAPCLAGVRQLHLLHTRLDVSLRRPGPATQGASGGHGSQAAHRRSSRSRTEPSVPSCNSSSSTREKLRRRWRKTSEPSRGEPGVVLLTLFDLDCS